MQIDLCCLFENEAITSFPVKFTSAQKASNQNSFKANDKDTPIITETSVSIQEKDDGINESGY